MANAWRKDRAQELLTPKALLSLLVVSTILLFIFFSSSRSFSRNPNPNISTKSVITIRTIPPYDCFKSPQSYPIIANVVEKLKYPFIYSQADLGNLPDKPHKNIVRILKGKPFRKPDISETIQDVLERIRGKGGDGFVVDVGTNVGMASFAAAVMGFKVIAFEPVFENLQRICDGAASDRDGNITIHKVIGRLDNSAVSAAGAKLAFKSNEEIAVQIRSIPIDKVISDTEPVVLLKIDVQGWEYHVLKGAKKLLSRKKSQAPYLIYEEDEKLLQASNSSTKEIREFLTNVARSMAQTLIALKIESR